MFRLLFGRTVDTLTLARNARTSPEMIDRFYAAPLQGEMNVGELQSKRRPSRLYIDAFTTLTAGGAASTNPRLEDFFKFRTALILVKGSLSTSMVAEPL